MKNLFMILLTLILLTSCSDSDKTSETVPAVSDSDNLASEETINIRDEVVVDEAITNEIYVGSIKSDVYHVPDCEWAKNILKKNEIFFNSVKEAEDSGYRACKTCI